MTLTPHQRVLGDTRLEVARLVVQRYEAGESVRAIAADLGRSYGFVHRLVVESGTPLRGRGGDTRSAEARARREGSSVVVDEGTQAAVTEPESRPKKSKKAKPAKDGSGAAKSSKPKLAQEKSAQGKSAPGKSVQEKSAPAKTAKGKSGQDKSGKKAKPEPKPAKKKTQKKAQKKAAKK